MEYEFFEQQTPKLKGQPPEATNNTYFLSGLFIQMTLQYHDLIGVFNIFVPCSTCLAVQDSNFSVDLDGV